jgi:hypothetical protein
VINPFSILFEKLLWAIVNDGHNYFVRQTFIAPFEKGYPAPGKAFLITHYRDAKKAQAHYDAIPLDPHRHIYNWNIEYEKQKLLLASGQPTGYKIYSAVMVKGASRVLNAEAQPIIRRHVEHSLRWAKGGQPIKCNIYLEFGEIAVHVKWGIHEARLKLADIKNG